MRNFCLWHNKLHSQPMTVFGYEKISRHWPTTMSICTTAVDIQANEAKDVKMSTIIEKAYELLYKAKNAGRNRHEISCIDKQSI